MIDEYYDGSDILPTLTKDGNYTRISPSNVSKFFSHPRQWWGETKLDEPGFEGSTSTVLGNIVHYFAELAGKRSKVPPNAEEIVEQYLLSRPNSLELDKDLIRSLWKEMSQTLISSCINGVNLVKTEEFIYHQILPGIFVAGTFDALRNTGNGNYTLRDYKTASQKPSAISYDYRMQLHVYAYILTKTYNTPIDQVELCYVTQPTKTLPCRYFHFIEPFTKEDYDKIESQLMTIAESIALWDSHPELQWALAQDIRLKPKEKQILFKD